MEIHPGIFVSSLSTDKWEPDPDVGGEIHLLCEVVDLQAGLSRYSRATEPFTWVPTNRETLLVLEGAARIEIADGPTLELKAGDMASLPKGAQTTWHVTVPFKEFWVLS